MPELSFAVTAAEVERFAVAPCINFKVAIECATKNARIKNVMLQCQVRIDAPRRRYSDDEKARLADLFGAPERWSRTLKGLLWTHASASVAAFDGSCVATLPVACSFDFNVAATQYFHGLEGGDVPLFFLFSGTVFYDEGQGLQIAQIDWNREARFSFPVATWQKVMAHYYPDSAWLRVPRSVFDRLGKYKREHGLASWDEALERLLDARADLAAGIETAGRPLGRPEAGRAPSGGSATAGAASVGAP